MSEQPFDLDKFMEDAREGILDHGHVAHYSDDPSEPYRDLPRAWTTGRTMWQRPELMITGAFTQEQMQEMLNEAVDIDIDTPLHPEARFELAGRPFAAMEAERGMFVIAMSIFGTVQALQLVWLDEAGEPGEPQPVFPANSNLIPGQFDPYAEGD